LAESPAAVVHLGQLDFRLADIGSAQFDWKLQSPLDRSEARLIAQWIQERIGLESLETRIAQPLRR